MVQLTIARCARPLRDDARDTSPEVRWLRMGSPFSALTECQLDRAEWLICLLPTLTVMCPGFFKALGTAASFLHSTDFEIGMFETLRFAIGGRPIDRDAHKALRDDKANSLSPRAV